MVTRATVKGNGMYNYAKLNTSHSNSPQELCFKLEKQANRIELLEDELFSANQALEEKTRLAAALEQDLAHTIEQLQNLS